MSSTESNRSNRLRVGRVRGLLAALIALTVITDRAAADSRPRHAIAMHGQPALPADFKHMPYVNPDAPKGGRIVWGVLGTFDSLNPFIVRGIAVQQMRGYVTESLLARGQNEPFTLYGLLAESVETDDERSYVTFRVNPKARFSDGKPVTAEDVLFSWQLLKERGRPHFRQYFGKVTKAEIQDPLTIRFDIAEAQDRELPLILGLMPILPKHAVNPETFEDTTMAPPVGSGPYTVTNVRPGASVTMTRNPDYWGRDLPINRGLWNFDEVRIDYYREANGMFEAFSRGLYDFRVENEPLRWHESYNFAAVKSGEVILDTVKTGLPKPSEFLVFNTRRPVFADIRVRRALTLLFDFEWINRNYFFDLYARSGGIFAGSELSAYGRPADARERELLKPYAAQIPADIMDGSYRLPVSDGSGRDRPALRTALALLKDAGYQLDKNVLRKTSDKTLLSFEILVTTRDQERIALTYARDLKRAGITANIRAVDGVQFDQRRINYEFDMLPNRWDNSLSPGNEQSFYWGSDAADVPGTRNYMGAKDPAIDAMIGEMLKARERPDFVAAVHALDRAWMSGAYAIPLYNVREQWLARWNLIQRPSTTSLVGSLPETWWARPTTPAPPDRK